MGRDAPLANKVGSGVESGGGISGAEVIPK